MSRTAAAASGKKFSARSEVTLPKPPARFGRLSTPATTNDDRASWACVRANSMNGAEGSHPTTDAGDACVEIAFVIAPVPHPTSSQWTPPGTRSHETNLDASCRLRRPMKSS
jgi:hypothetical protein